MFKQAFILSCVVSLIVPACDEGDQGIAKETAVVKTTNPPVEQVLAEVESAELADYARFYQGVAAAEYATLDGSLSSEDLTSLQSSEDEDWGERSCALEYSQPCVADLATCAVRCCDDSLFKSVQFCGNCGTWAKGACASHGTRKRIRWEPPYYNVY